MRPVDILPANWEHFEIPLNTAPFYVEATGPDMPEMDDKVRVLTPVACMCSSFNNLITLRRDAEIEIARINALKILCYFLHIEQFDEQLKLALLRERYVVLNIEWAARGCRGFERNCRDD
ncbi:MAG: hypothetical protein H6R25_1368 [Proteobacteria bacterium]|nr:hypothetical protein [Pseudomonadota bacterium]